MYVRLLVGFIVLAIVLDRSADRPAALYAHVVPRERERAPSPRTHKM